MVDPVDGTGPLIFGSHWAPPLARLGAFSLASICQRRTTYSRPSRLTGWAWVSSCGGTRPLGRPSPHAGQALALGALRLGAGLLAAAEKGLVSLVVAEDSPALDTLLETA